METVLSNSATTLSVKDEVPRRFQPEWKPAMASHALVLTGVRRCDKSTMQAQVRRGIRGPAVTLNLEDTRLYGMGPEDFPTLLDAGRRVCLTGSNATDRCLDWRQHLP